MAKEGSVAPKERVNIVYKPATGDASEEVGDERTSEMDSFGERGHERTNVCGPLGHHWEY